MATHSSILAWRIPWAENPMGREAWRATLYTIKKNQTQLKRLSIHTHTGLLDVLPMDAQEGPVKNAKGLGRIHNGLPSLFFTAFPLHPS